MTSALPVFVRLKEGGPRGTEHCATEGVGALAASRINGNSSHSITDRVRRDARMLPSSKTSLMARLVAGAQPRQAILAP